MNDSKETRIPNPERGTRNTSAILNSLRSNSVKETAWRSNQ
jgi:hypothetical protein